MIRNFSDSSNLITKKNNKIVYDERAFRDSYKIVLNIISFIFILISLTMDSFNIKVDLGYDPILSSILIICAAVLCSYFIRKLVGAIVDKKQIPPITAKELKVLGISPDVEIITEKVIEKKIEEKAQEIVDKHVPSMVKHKLKKNQKNLNYNWRIRM